MPHKRKSSAPVRRITPVYTIDNTTDPGLSDLLGEDLRNLHASIGPTIMEIEDNIERYGIRLEGGEKGLQKIATQPIPHTGVMLGIYTGQLHFAQTRVADNGRHLNLKPVRGIPLFVEGSGPSRIQAADCNHSCTGANLAYKYLRITDADVLEAVVVVTTRRIAAGEELLLDYGEDFFRRDGSRPCLCADPCPLNRYF